EAERAFRDILDRDAGFFHAVRGLALVARDRGDFPRARSLFRDALALEPGDLWVRWEIAQMLAVDGRNDEAKAEFTRILASDPKFVAAHRGLWRIARETG